MANRFPLIFNSGAGQIQELAASDNLDLTSSNLVNAGILFTSSGSQTAPSLQIGSGTTYNPGLYSPGTDQVAVATNGVERVKFGTTEVVFNDGGTDYDFRVEGDTNANLLFVDASTDRIGIGTSSPSKRLHVSTTSSTAYNSTDFDQDYLALRLTNTTDDKAVGMLFNVGTNGDAAITCIETSDGETALAFGTRIGGVRSEKIRITPEGRLGIGTSSPSADGPLTLTNSTTTNPTIFFERESTNYNGAIQCSAFGTITFYNGADSSVVSGLTPRMTIDGQYGRVGIGTTPVVDLDVAPAASTATFRIHARSNTTPVAAIELVRGTSTTFGADGSGDYRIKNDTGNLSFEYGDTGVTTERARIDSSGRLLVGTTSAFVNGFNNAFTSSQLSKDSGNHVRCISDTRSVATVNNSTVDAWVGRRADGNAFNASMSGHFYVLVGAGNGFSGVYSIVTCSNSTSNATLTAVSTVTRGVSPVSSVQIATDGPYGAIKLTITYINNADVVDGLISYVSFVGLAG